MRLAREQLAQDDTPATEYWRAERLEPLVLRLGHRRAYGAGPAPGGDARRRLARPAPDRAAPPQRSDAGRAAAPAEPGEAVAGHETGATSSQSASSTAGREAACPARCRSGSVAPAVETTGPRARREICGGEPLRRQRRACRAAASRGGAARAVRSGAAARAPPAPDRRGEAAPRDPPAKQSSSSNDGLVAGDTCRQHLLLPAPARELETVELRDDRGEPVAAVELRPRVACCQRSRNRVKSAAVTGSISRRRRPSVRRWMRASSLRSHHSSPSRARREAPAHRDALGFETSRAISTTRAVEPRRAARSLRRTGPAPRAIARTTTTASSRVATGEPGGAATGRSKRSRPRAAASAAPPAQQPTVRSRPNADDAGPPARGHELVRPGLPAGPPLRRREARPDRGAASCSSSASRTSGQACASTTSAIASRVERADARATPRVGSRRRSDRARAALLERRVVEEGVRRFALRISCAIGRAARASRRARVRDLAGRRWLRARAQPVDVHRLVQAVVDRLGAPADGRAARSAPPPWLSWHATCAGKTAASRSSARMRWMVAGTRLPPWWREQRERARRVPAPARSRTSAPAAPPARGPPRRCPGRTKSKTRSRAGSCAARRARARRRRRSPPPAARSRRCSRSACAAPGPRRG